MLVVLYYLTVVFFVVVILGGILRLAGFSIFKLLRYLREELMIVLGTASSDAVLPQIMRKLEHMGIKDSTVGLVIPTGYSFNLDAFSIYLTLATVFIAQATNTPLAFSGPAADPRRGAPDLQGRARHPGLGDRRARRHPLGGAGDPGDRPGAGALGRLVHGHGARARQHAGNCVATVVIAAWEGDIDREKAHRVLNGQVDPVSAEAEIDPVGLDTAGAQPQAI